MFDKLHTELAGSARLRWGLALIVAVLWLYGALLLRDERDERIRAFRTASVQLARLQQAAQQAEWPQRLDEAKVAVAQLESGLWRGDSLGLSRAALQDWLAQQLKQANVSRPLISLAAQEEDAAGSASAGGAGPAALAGDAAAAELANGVWRVRAKLNFDFAPEGLQVLLAKLAAPSSRVVVESVRVVREPIGRVEMVVVAYFQKPQVASAAVAGAGAGPGGAGAGVSGGRP